MIDSQSLDAPHGHPAYLHPMSRLENSFVLDSETDQRIDIEEAAVTEITRGHTPICDAIVLLLEKFVEKIGVGVQLLKDLVNRASGRSVFAQQLQQHFGQQLFVAMPPR